MKIQLLHKDARIPQRIRKWDAGLSLISLEDKILEPWERYRFKLGIAIELERWYTAITQWRSGHAFHYGIDTIGNVIDCNYRWEISVLLINNGDKFFKIQKGDNIAQLVILPVRLWWLEQVDILDHDTERGDAWFWSSDYL